MIYKLLFHKKALKEWKKLTSPIKDQFKKKLEKRLANPKVQSDRLSGMGNNRYKIKLRSSGYRLVYEVNDDEICIVVLVVNNRDKVYEIAKSR